MDELTLSNFGLQTPYTCYHQARVLLFYFTLFHSIGAFFVLYISPLHRSPTSTIVTAPSLPFGPRLQLVFSQSCHLLFCLRCLCTRLWDYTMQKGIKKLPLYPRSRSNNESRNYVLCSFVPPPSRQSPSGAEWSVHVFPFSSQSSNIPLLRFLHE